MDSKITVEITKRGTNAVLAKVDATKIAHFSTYVRGQLARLGPAGGKAKTVYLPYTYTAMKDGDEDEKALLKVLRWIDSNDVKDPQPLTGDAVGIEELPEFVYVYRAAYMLHVDRTLRSNAIRENIVAYIRSAPLRFDEFAMVLEVCDFDISLGYVAKNNTMLHETRGTGVPDLARIEAYAKAFGFWHEMVNIENTIR